MPDVNFDILRYDQRVVIELFLDHSRVKRSFKHSMLPHFFQDVDRLSIPKDVDLHLHIWPVLNKADVGIYSMFLDPIIDELACLSLDVKVLG
jgi:hypothetical protein